MLWKISSEPIPYEESMVFMENHVQTILDGKGEDMIWLLEHPPLYTYGFLTRKEDLLEAQRFPVYATNRGGKFTYHGPGQRIAYIMMNLGPHVSIRAFIEGVENWIKKALKHFHVETFSFKDKPGVWTFHDNKPKKIAALGFRFRKWVSFHGFSLNVSPNLEHFSGIIPCGLPQKDYGVTSLEALGLSVTYPEIDDILKKKFLESLSLIQNSF